MEMPQGVFVQIHTGVLMRISPEFEKFSRVPIQFSSVPIQILLGVSIGIPYTVPMEFFQEFLA